MSVTTNLEPPLKRDLSLVTSRFAIVRIVLIINARLEIQ